MEAGRYRIGVGNKGEGTGIAKDKGLVWTYTDKNIKRKEFFVAGNKRAPGQMAVLWWAA